MKPKNILLALLLVICVPPLAHANVAISFLGVVTAFHLFAGNAALGLIEGNLLTRYFGITNWKSVGVMVPANYFSSWAGFSFAIGLSTNSYGWTFITPDSFSDGWWDLPIC